MKTLLVLFGLLFAGSLFATDECDPNTQDCDQAVFNTDDCDPNKEDCE